MSKVVDQAWDMFLSRLDKEQREIVESEVCITKAKAGHAEAVAREYVMLLHGCAVPLPKWMKDE